MTHLYQPRAIYDWSIMPAYPYLFEIKDKAAAGDVVVALPERYAPKGKVVVARPQAPERQPALEPVNRPFSLSSAKALPPLAHLGGANGGTVVGRPH